MEEAKARPAWHYTLGPAGMMDREERVMLGAFALVLFLGACTATLFTPAQSLYDTQARYTQLGAVALHYILRPLCEPMVLAEPCADEGVVRAIQKVDQEVFNVLLAAEAARGTVDADTYRQLAASALARLRALLVQHVT